jgi:CheY-like chemotaxis protein
MEKARRRTALAAKRNGVYAVDSATGGPEALRVVEEEGPFDLFVIDVMIREYYDCRYDEWGYQTFVDTEAAERRKVLEGSSPMKTLTCSIAVAATLLSACSGSTPSSPTASTPVIGSVVITASANVAAGEDVEYTFDVTPSTNARTVWRIDFGDRSRTVGFSGASSRVTLSHLYRAAGSYTVTAHASVDSNPDVAGTLDVNVS